jgi:predicted RecA/RadA family phage recombinase
MNIGLNAAQARAKSSQDMVVFNECTAIMNAIITTSATGVYETYIGDGTTMTECTPSTIKIGTINSPTVNVGDTLIINSTTITLGTTGTNLNSIIADINDAAVTGITASKDAGYLVLNVVLDASATWSYEIGTGTANASLGFSDGIYVPPTPTSTTYFTSWQGAITNRALDNQMNAVIKYFGNLGYKVNRLTNSATGKTFRWHIYW